MRQSQQQAALAVRRVLDGQTLGPALADAGANEAGPARALVHELAYGTLRHYGFLEALVRALSDKPIPDAKLAALMAVALYQLEHAKAPAFAVVDQAVQAAAEIARPAAKGLVNAVLRRFLRERASLVERVQGDPVARWSHQRWWIERVRADHPDHWASILAAGNERAPLSLRINQRRLAPDAMVRRLAEIGIEAYAAGRSGVVLAVPRPVHELPGFDDGLFSVQDLGAQLAAPLLDAQDGMAVLDACAAPGGKTTHLLELADLTLTALDSDASRLVRVRENLARLKLEGPAVRVMVGSASAPASWWDGRPFDRIMADVPCSASGVVRRHPDGKWLRRASDIPGFVTQQRAILDVLWPLLARGGRLLYTTCSVFRDENQARVDEFIATHADALHESVMFETGIAHSGGQLLPSPEPGGHNQDGFFYTLLRKA